MNHIEILENKIQCFRHLQNTLDDDEKELFEDGIQQKEIEAIENLIQENKELKEKIKGLECEIEIKKYCKVDEVINDLTYYKNLAKEYQGNCIPKSKVKAKIEEFNIPILDVLDKLPIMPQTIERGCGAKDGIIYVLQELLEEGE